MWWPGASPPLGGPFTFAPEDYSFFPLMAGNGQNNTYIGYSLEKTCLQTPYHPFADRPRQIYVLAKKLHYFLQHDYILPAPSGNVSEQLTDSFYAEFSEEANVTFVGQFKQGEAPEGSGAPPGIAQVPRMKRPEFQSMIARSRVLMGIGAPGLSPSPWEALCLGVPFIHPIKSWDRDHPEDRRKWQGQHNAMIYYGLDEPYVYHVKIGDREALKRAIRTALSTPIDRCVDPLSVGVGKSTDFLPVKIHTAEYDDVFHGGKSPACPRNGLAAHRSGADVGDGVQTFTVKACWRTSRVYDDVS